MVPTLSSRWFLAVFVMIMIVTAAFSWRIFSRVQSNVAAADAGIHAVAWAILLHADRRGRFPRTAEAIAREPWSAELVTLVAEDAAWPRTAAQAATGPSPAGDDEWTSRLRDGMRLVRVQWPTTGDGPPRLSTPGYATSIGVVHDANAWLEAVAEAITPANTHDGAAE